MEIVPVDGKSSGERLPVLAPVGGSEEGTVFTGDEARIGGGKAYGVEPLIGSGQQGGPLGPEGRAEEEEEGEEEEFHGREFADNR